MGDARAAVQNATGPGLLSRAMPSCATFSRNILTLYVSIMQATCSDYLQTGKELAAGDIPTQQAFRTARSLAWRRDEWGPASLACWR